MLNCVNLLYYPFFTCNQTCNQKFKSWILGNVKFICSCLSNCLLPESRNCGYRRLSTIAARLVKGARAECRAGRAEEEEEEELKTWRETHGV